MQVTQSAKAYEPIGDPEHTAYGQDFIWSCTCGKNSAFVSTRDKAEYRAQNHEQYCDGETTVDTTL